MESYFSALITFERLNQIGPFLSGIALLIAAGAAWATYFLVGRRTLHRAWTEAFRQLYDEFWKDPDIAKVRRMLISDIEYGKIEPILLERLKTERNVLDSAANNVIELIDRYCSFIMKVEFFDRPVMTEMQRKLWQQTYVEFWIKKMAEKERSALRAYVEKYWPQILL